MSAAISLHVGLDSYGAGDYVIRPTPVRSAEADARALAALAGAEGFTPTVLTGPRATRAEVLRALREAIALRAGSQLVISVSGHGVQIPDTPPDPTRPRPASARNRQVGDEPDGFDEAWCLYDGFLIDDELAEVLAGFAAGVRIFVVSDTCHSGTMLPRAPAAPPPIAASVLHLAACDDTGCAFDRGDHGVFTGALLDVWAAGFAGSHPALRDAVRARTVPLQRPVLTACGKIDVEFLAARPFTPPRARLR